ncbi:MAG TPA: PRC-barrel domain-containing protein [Gammaproteobacteria bacterium]
MRHVPLPIIVAAPLLAVSAVAAGDAGSTANDNIVVDSEQLHDAVPATEIIGKDVLMRDGRDVGDVEDVIIAKDGSVKSLLVSRDDGAAGGAGDDVQLEWNNVSYNRQQQVVRLDDSASGLQAAQRGGARAPGEDGDLRVSELVGMDVNLSDKQLYGEVHDVLIDTDQGNAAAIVVDSGGFFTNETRALPVTLDAVDPGKEQLDLEYTEQQVESAEELDLESITDIT